MVIAWSLGAFNIKNHRTSEPWVEGSKTLVIRMVNERTSFASIAEALDQVKPNIIEYRSEFFRSKFEGLIVCFQVLSTR